LELTGQVERREEKAEEVSGYRPYEREQREKNIKKRRGEKPGLWL